MAESHILPMIILLLHVIALERLNNVASELIGLKLNLITRNSPLISDARKSPYLRLSETHTNEATLSKIVAPFKNAGDYFLVQLGIGEPNQNVYLTLDTTVSPITWTQCRNSYDQHKSHTYRKIPNNSPVCKYPIFRSRNGDCAYNISYPDGGSAIGVASEEKFVFLTLKNTTTHVNKITFGCTQETTNLNLGPSSGILSMNKSPESLISRVSSITGGRFSYCLFLSPDAKGYLRFGNDIISGKGRVQRAQLVQHLYYPYAYALELTDISLGNFKLGIQKGAFAINRKNTGFIIDTGTIISKIDRATYIRIRKVLANRMDKFRLMRTFVPGFDLCYKMVTGLNLDRVLVPMTFHFRGGAKLRLARENVFVLLDKDKSSFCLGLMPTDGPTMLGAMQQHNTRFTYDVNKGTVSFLPEDCVASERA